MSDLCKCGHAKDHHFTPRLGGRCFRHECECVAFETPAADRDDLDAILSEHEHAWEFEVEAGREFSTIYCVGHCNWSLRQYASPFTQITSPTDEYCYGAHRAHVAQMVLESGWLAAVKAEAFKRGWIDSAVHHATCHECGTGPLRHGIPDPYRADRVDAEDGGR